MKGLHQSIASLRNDRGEADPILLVVSMAVTLIVSASIIGAISMVLQLGTGYVAEQTTSVTRYRRAECLGSGLQQRLHRPDGRGPAGVLPPKAPSPAHGHG